MPSMLEIVRSNFPTSTVVRYVVIGSASRHAHVVRPAAVAFERRTPFDIAVSPAGTVTEMSYVALSCGLSLQGNQPGDPCGSPTATAPSSVGTQPSIDWSGSVTTVGVPW